MPLQRLLDREAGQEVRRQDHLTVSGLPQLGSSVTSRKVLTVIPCSACYIPLHMMDGSIAVVACADITSSYGISPHDMMCGSYST